MSPLLFVIVAGLLQSVVHDMLARGVLTLPILSHDTNFPIIQYADDTIIILSVVEDQLVALKSMLHIFQQSTGLR